MLSELKETMDPITEIEFWDQAVGIPVSSQGTTVSDGWYLDNNPLIAACEQNADVAWKFREVQSLDMRNGGCSTSTNGSSDGTFLETISTGELACLSTVALSPVSNPPTSPIVENVDDFVVPEKMDTEVGEIDAILTDIFKRTQEENERMRIEQIENWLLMASSSQGNEFLSSPEDQITKKMLKPDFVAITPESVEINSSMASTSPLVAFPAEQTSILSAKSDDSSDEEYTEKRKRTVKRQKQRKRSGDMKIVDKDKKRNQNKEAAQRYRHKKKVEAEHCKQKRNELQKINKQVKAELRDKIKEREILIDLWKSCVKSKTNPNFVVHFPLWVKI